jgi:hypothetical protein
LRDELHRRTRADGPIRRPQRPRRERRLLTA